MTQYTLYKGYARRVYSRVHWENYISNSFQIERDMIVVTVFLLILNQIVIHLVQNRKKNCHYDYIPFKLKGNGIRVFSVQAFVSYIAYLCYAGRVVLYLFHITYIFFLYLVLYLFSDWKYLILYQAYIYYMRDCFIYSVSLYIVYCFLSSYTAYCIVSSYILYIILLLLVFIINITSYLHI